MAWSGVKNVELTVRHAVRDSEGALVTGVAGSVATVLVDPDGAGSAITVTVVEIGTTGWYELALTLDEAGTWILTITNPSAPTADGGVFDYPLQISEAGLAGYGEGSFGLTTRALVKSHLGLGDSSTTHNVLIDSLVTGLSSQLQSRSGRHFGSWVHTETYDGLGVGRLWLEQGPLQSVTSIEELSYSDAGEAALELDAWRYEGVGRSSELGGDDRRAHIVRLDGGKFSRGVRNWRVIYTAGYVNIPAGLTMDCTRLVVAHFRRRDIEGLVSKGSVDLSATPLDPTDLDRMADRIAAQWRQRLGII